MKALDTNILVRFVTLDDKRQADAVLKLLEDTKKKGQQLFVPLVVVLELIWVLESGYELSNDDILDALEQLSGLSVLKCEQDDCVLALIEKGRNFKADLSDLLIGIVSSRHGCTKIVTFDKKAAKTDGFELLKA